MSGKKLLPYLVVLLVVAGGFFFSEYYRSQKQTQEKAAQQIFRVKEKEITAVTLKRGDHEIRLQKNQGWQILQPLRTGADTFTVNSLLDALVSLKKQREINIKPEQLSHFGLAHAALILDFTAGSQHHELRIGDKAPGGKAYYAQKDQQAQVLLISSIDKGSLDRDLTALRNKVIFTFSPDKVTEFQLMGPGRKLKLKKTGAAPWTLKGQPKTRIRSDKVESLLRQLSLLRAREFVSEEPQLLKKYGLNPGKAIQLTVFQGKTKETLSLGNKQDERLYAHKQGDFPIILVDKYIVDRLPASKTQLEDRRLWSGEKVEVDKIAWGPPDKQIKAAKQKDAWQITSPEGKVLKQSIIRVSGPLWKLKELNYQRLLPSGRPISNTPYFILKLWGPEDKLLLNLEAFSATFPNLVQVRATQGKQTLEALVSKKDFTIWRQGLDNLTAPKSSKPTSK